MDYLEFYGLEQEPFSSAPISRFYYNSAQHQRALVRLMYAVDTMKGLAVLIGEVGTGKTTLARRMLDSLPEEEYESALLVIIHSGITADWFLSRVARQLGVEDPAPEKLKLLNQLYNRLIELHEMGKKAVVLIDEAQMLHAKEIMEEFRGLLNLELPESKLITFVFFGLPDLEDHMKLDEPLAQRVALKCKLESFTYESTEGYINHRLRLAGAKIQLFPPESVKIIHHFSRGIPRLINTICDNSLFEGYLLKKKMIEPELVKSVVMDLGLAPSRARKISVPAGPPGTVIKSTDFRPMQESEAPPPEPPFAESIPEAALEIGIPEGLSVEPVEDDSDTELSFDTSESEPSYQPPLEDARPADFEPPAPPELATPDNEYAVPEPAAAEPGDDLDAMFNEISGEKQEPKSEEDGNFDDLFDNLEKK